jgi:integrase
VFTRKRYQFGWLELRKRKKGPAIWLWRCRKDGPKEKGDKDSAVVGDLQKYPTRALALKAAEVLRLTANRDNPGSNVTFGALADKYMLEKLPKRYSTASKYRSRINHHIKPRWGDYPIAKIKPLPVEEWIEELALAPKTKGHIRSMMHILFRWAMKWELIEAQINLMSLVHVEGSSKRVREPVTLTAEEFHHFLQFVAEPVRTMCVVAMCLGLRASELVGLKWGDVDWTNRHVMIQRGVVMGIEGEVKTRKSHRAIPLAPDLAAMLWSYKQETARGAGDSDWVFPSSRTGRPWWPASLVRTQLIPAGVSAGVGRIGWHTFRHSYSTLLRALKVDVKVQQELLRHSDIRTTLNIYTKAVPEALRDANSKLVEMVLPERRTA